MCPPSCCLQVGRRLTEVTILSRSVVRIWGVLERVLQRHEHQLSRSDRTMRVVHVTLDGGANNIIGAPPPPKPPSGCQCIIYMRRQR